MKRCAHLLLTDRSYAVELSIEASAALGMLRRAGAGCVRYLLIRLWTQQKIPAGDVNARKVNTALSSAGLGSKQLARDTVLRLMNVVQIYAAPTPRVQLCVPYGFKEVHESQSSVSRR